MNINSVIEKQISYKNGRGKEKRYYFYSIKGLKLLSDAHQ